MPRSCPIVTPAGPFLLAGTAVLLTACALAPQRQAEGRIEAVAAVAERLRSENQQQASSSAVVRTHRPRLAGEELAVHPQDPLPEILTRPLNYSTPGTQTLAEVLLAVSQLLGLRILAAEISQTTAAGTATPGAAPASPAAPLSGRVQLDFVNRAGASLLDEIAAQNDASWRYVARTRTIEFFRFETRTLSVYLPPGAKNINAAISLANVAGGSAAGSGGASAGASGGDVSVSQTLVVDPWSSIMGGIAALLSEGQGPADSTSPAPAMARPAGAPGGAALRGGLSASGRAGRATANPELGIVTVTARPAAVERIAAYLQSINARFAQNVMVDVKIYSLTLDDRAAIGFSLDAVYRRLGRYAVSLVGPTPGQIGSTPGQLTISSESGRFSGSDLVVQALSQFGNVALQTQGQVIAINGQPSPIQVASEVNYLASSSTTTAANVGTTTTLQPGTRVVGFTANFLPLILGDNRILLQYQMQISQLTALTQVMSGNASIQTPQISSQSLQQQAFVQDGQSIVLFGFDQNRDTTERSLGLAGASRTGTAQRQMIVIVLQVNGGRKHDA